MTNSLTAERLRAALIYDPETGDFTRRVAVAKFKAGERAGSIDKRGIKRYVRVRIDQEDHYAHRLAWLYVTGQVPAGEIDHIDGDSLNNRINNLRDVPGLINRQNIRGPHADSLTGVQGVSWVKAKCRWRASITVNRRARCIGLYDTIDEAHAAYVAEKRRLHPGCTL
jgi:hypothetical protein